MFFVEIFRNAYDSDPPKKPPEQGVWMAHFWGSKSRGCFFDDLPFNLQLAAWKMG